MPFKIPFKFKGIHNCEAVLITCMDFRFWGAVTKFVKRELKIKRFDLPDLPGASKAVNDATEGSMAWRAIDVACDLHHVKKIIIVDHADCGAYGGVAKFNGDIEVEHKFHVEELKKAREKLEERYPKKEILTYYAKLVDGGENIEFFEVD